MLEALPRSPAAGVRWVPPEQWHVTLRFLGRADEADAATALAHLRVAPAVARLGPRVSRLGRSVVCVPVSGLEGVAAAVAAVTAGVGEPPDPRPFAGHLTLARLRHRGACGLAGAAVTGRFPVGAVDLVRSRTDQHGATYETLQRVALEG